MSIRLRLTLTYSALIVCTGLGMIAAAQLTLSIMNGPITDLFALVATITAILMALVGAVGSWLLAGWMLRPLERPTAAARADRPAGLSIRTRLTLTYSMLIVCTGLAMIGAVQLTVSIMNGALFDALYLVATIAVILVAFFGAIASWLIAGWMLRPLQRLNAVARQVDETTLGIRLNLAGPDDEVRSLSDTFDTMIARLASAFSNQALFAANASHELRTPLATMKTILQVSLRERHDPQTRETMQRLLQTVESMSVTTSSLLDLAQARNAERGDEFDLAETVAAALEAEAVPEEVATRRIAVTRELSATRVVANRRLVENLVSNLVRNAVLHNIEGGWLGVTTRTDVDGRAVLVVENSGDLVPADRVPFLTEPFYRARSRTAGGHGLGLALVKAIADAHGADVTITPRQPNGLVVTVRFDS